jgi:drug/metabolite transporter (DMT)-like permease
MSTDRRNAFAALTVAGVIWGLTIPFSKLALGWLDPLWLGVARFALAAPLLAIAARRTLRAAITLPAIGWGIVFYGVGVALQNSGIERTSVTHSALILATVPAFVALIAAALGRGNATAQSWFGFLLALGGVGLVAGAGGHSAMSGDALMLACAVMSAAYVVAQPGVLAGRDPVAITAVQMAAGAVATLPFALAGHGVPAAPPAGPALWGFAGLVVLGSVLPFALYAWGQARVVPEVAGAFVNLEPLVGAFVGAFMFHDPFGSTQLAGALALVVGIAVSVLPSPRGTIGRRISTWSPPSLDSLSVINPRWSPTCCDTMASPRPVPREVVAPRANGCRSRSRSAGGMPGPSSSTRRIADVPSSCSRVCTRPPARP